MPSPSASPAVAGAAPVAGWVPLLWALLGAALVLGMVGLVVWRWNVGRKRWAEAQQTARNPVGNERQMDIVEKGTPRSPKPPGAP